MRKWKLKKDTPTAVAGTICTTPSDQEHIIVDPYGVEYDIAKIDNFDKWFEEVKEFKEWKPKMGDSFKTLSSCGDIYCSIWNGGSDHEYCLSIGNCYPLDTPNKVIIKEQKLIPQAMHRLKMAAKKAWFEFNGGEGPDWSDGKQDKWSIQYEHARGVLIIVVTGLTQNLGRVYFPTRESCQACINNNLDDLKLLFGV